MAIVLEKRGPPTLRRDQTSEAQLFCFQIVSIYPLVRQKSPYFSMVKIILWKHLSHFRFALVLISWIFSLECLGSRRVPSRRIRSDSWHAREKVSGPDRPFKSARPDQFSSVFPKTLYATIQWPTDCGRAGGVTL